MELLATLPWSYWRLRRPGVAREAAGSAPSERGRDRRGEAKRVQPGPGSWAGRISPSRVYGHGVWRRSSHPRAGGVEALRRREPPRWPVRAEHSRHLKPQSQRELKDLNRGPTWRVQGDGTDLQRLGGDVRGAGQGQHPLYWRFTDRTGGE